MLFARRHVDFGRLAATLCRPLILRA